jgi:hypothetical protein
MVPSRMQKAYILAMATDNRNAGQSDRAFMRDSAPIVRRRLAASKTEQAARTTALREARTARVAEALSKANSTVRLFK